MSGREAEVLRPTTKLEVCMLELEPDWNNLNAIYSTIRVREMGRPEPDNPSAKTKGR